jgi:hypothetical protein
MIASGKNPVLVTQFIRNLRGGSQPILAVANDGFRYAVKFANNLQGPNVLFNECAGNELYRACGLPVPEWAALSVSDTFLDRNRDCWMQTPEGPLRPSSGLCFGSLFLGQNCQRLFEILPASMFKRVRNQISFGLAWLIDICAEHVDNRQAIFVEDAAGWLDACFIDHGHFFGGPKAESNRNFRVSRYLDPRIYGGVSFGALLDFQGRLKGLDVDKLRQRVEAIPAEWSYASAKGRFEDCLQRLTMASLVRHVLETINNNLEQSAATESGNVGGKRKPPSEVLRDGVPGAGLGPSHAHLPHCV